MTNNDDAATLDLLSRFAAIVGEIGKAADAAGRSFNTVKLVAVTKTHPEAAIRAALALGHRCFGENRVQEAAAKYPPLQQLYPDLELHMIGPLQTNKLRDAITIFDVIETVDRVRLAEGLSTALEKQAGRMTHCLIQVNTGEEAQKAGIWPADADNFIRDCRERLGLPVSGLMAIPPVDDEPSLHFALLREIAGRHGLSTLSMGMSGDFGLAIQQGATHVRIGTAIFGTRPPPAEVPG